MLRSEFMVESMLGERTTPHRTIGAELFFSGALTTTPHHNTVYELVV